MDARRVSKPRNPTDSLDYLHLTCRDRFCRPSRQNPVLRAIADETMLCRSVANLAGIDHDIRFP